jgi:hypothetical protein
MTTKVQIPGEMIATIENGRITGYTFSPSAAYAGYFGPEIINVEGDKINSEEFFDLVSDSLVKSSFFIAEWTC